MDSGMLKQCTIIFNVNSGCNSAASPSKTKEERANLKNRFAIFEICSLHKPFRCRRRPAFPQSTDNEWISPITHVIFKVAKFSRYSGKLGGVSYIYCTAKGFVYFEIFVAVS
jgi:hypothetical protein